MALTPPKHILINGHKIHFRFVQSVLWTLIVTSLSVAAVAALYYLITQQSYFGYSLKASWDGLFSYTWWPSYRHGLRDFGEPVLAAMAVHSLIVNSWRKDPDQRLTGFWLVLRVVLALITAFLVIILGVYVIDYALKTQLAHITATASSGAAGNALSGLNWEAFVFSFIVVHLIRKLWQPVGNTISLVFTESAIKRAKGGMPLWVRLPLAPPAMRERFVWTAGQPQPQGSGGHDIATRLVMGLTVVMFLLAIFGEYVLHGIAK